MSLWPKAAQWDIPEHWNLDVLGCCVVNYGLETLVACWIMQEGEPQGRHVVIVDDLVQSGGTLIECHALLASLGAKHGESFSPHVKVPLSWTDVSGCDYQIDTMLLSTRAGHYISGFAIAKSAVRRAPQAVTKNSEVKHDRESETRWALMHD